MRGGCGSEDLMEVRTMVYCVPIYSGEVPVTIGYDIRVYEGVTITLGCSPLY